jgi:hypothetical protein
MALADNTFKAPDLNTPERLYSLRVEPGLRYRPVTFKPSILGTPLFRNDAGDTLLYSSLRRQTIVTGSDTHIYYLLTELLWEQYCRLFGQHPKVRKQIADSRYRWTKTRNPSQAITMMPGYLSRPQWRPLAFQVPQDLALSTTCLD